MASNIQFNGKSIFLLGLYGAILGLIWKYVQPVALERGPLYLIALYVGFMVIGFFGLIGVDRAANGRPAQPFVRHPGILIGFILAVLMIGMILAGLLILLVPAIQQ